MLENSRSTQLAQLEEGCKTIALNEQEKRRERVHTTQYLSTKPFEQGDLRTLSILHKIVYFHQLAKSRLG